MKASPAGKTRKDCYSSVYLARVVCLARESRQ